MTLKKYLSIALAKSVDIDELAKNRLVILTAAGTIIGKLASDNDDKDQKLVTELVGNIASNYAKEFNVDISKDLQDNDGYMTLVDARLLSSNGLVRDFKTLTVFFDQIIGITIGFVDDPADD